MQVGVFDTGVDPLHDDFLGRLIRETDADCHGTHVGGIVGSSGLQGLPTNCDLVLKTTIFDDETNEILAEAHCTFQIPQQ